MGRFPIYLFVWRGGVGGLTCHLIIIIIFWVLAPSLGPLSVGCGSYVKKGAPEKLYQWKAKSMAFIVHNHKSNPSCSYQTLKLPISYMESGDLVTFDSLSTSLIIDISFSLSLKLTGVLLGPIRLFVELE